MEAVPTRQVLTGSPDGTQVPYRLNTNVNVHHNSVTGNMSYGDELFSATPAGAGGVTFCTGADFYKFNYNWLCGNLSTGDGGGLAHAGFSYNGDIEHNSILFNQSTNPTVPANGRSEEHTSELQSRLHLVCRLLLEKKKDRRH